jgi:hypothetical protein
VLDVAIEGGDDLDAGQLRACCQIRLGKVDPVLLVDHDTQEQCLAGYDDRRKADDRAHELGNLVAQLCRWRGEWAVKDSNLRPWD